MAKHTKITLFKDIAPRAETRMDKISRAAKGIIDNETKNREDKTARLRKARLEREASAPEAPDAPAQASSKTARKTPPAKAAEKS